MATTSTATTLIANTTDSLAAPAPKPFVIGSRDKSAAWYDPPLTEVDKDVRDLLENYSHVPSGEVVPRCVEMRDRIWEIFPWPCVGQFRFIDLSLSRQPSYSRILATIKGGAALLDVGCCFAQDLRKLMHDGAPSENLLGLEQQSEFIDLAYDFFNDRNTFKGRFLSADILDRSNTEVQALRGKMAVVQLGMILHIWDMEGQIKACERVIELLMPKKGALVVGQSVGHLHGAEAPSRHGKMYKQSAETFAKMWEEVGRRTGTKWEVRAQLDAGLGIEQKNRTWDDPLTRRLQFEVERLE